MIRRPPRSTRTDTLFPYTTLFRSAQIQPGVSTRDDVAVILGTPTTVSTFEDNIWYYIGQRTEKSAFWNPEIVDRRVLEVTFDDQGVVRTIQELGMEGGPEVALVDSQTPTSGRKSPFFEQQLGEWQGLGERQSMAV